MPDSVPDPKGMLAAVSKACGVKIPELYLPAPETDLTRFAVVACDQYTSEPEYWEETARIVGSAPSALHLVLPEYYLEHPGKTTVERRIDSINAAMRDYLKQGVLKSIGTAAVVLKRTPPGKNGRLGLVLAIDLEKYDYKPGNRNLIRASEGTVLDRIPPRVAIRRDAPLELPHVQLLIDDPKHSVIEPLFRAAEQQCEPLYNFELMQGGGHLAGYKTTPENPDLQAALNNLANLESGRRDGMLFAVGDGNHSLATAKTHYDNNKAVFGPDHPARYALVEIINIHDSGLEFEPIHRVMFNIEPELFRQTIAAFFGSEATITAAAEPLPGSPEMLPAAIANSDGSLVLPLLQPDGCRMLNLAKPVSGSLLAAERVSGLIELLVEKHGGRVDYIHGSAAMLSLAANGASGLLLPALEKDDFFTAIARDGVLPRKTFSMGEAHEKRYYLEARKII